MSRATVLRNRGRPTGSSYAKILYRRHRRCISFVISLIGTTNSSFTGSPLSKW